MLKFFFGCLRFKKNAKKESKRLRFRPAKSLELSQIQTHGKKIGLDPRRQKNRHRRRQKMSLDVEKNRSDLIFSAGFFLLYTLKNWRKRKNVKFYKLYRIKLMEPLQKCAEAYLFKKNTKNGKHVRQLDHKLRYFWHLWKIVIMIKKDLKDFTDNVIISSRITLNSQRFYSCFFQVYSRYFL